MNKIYFLNSTSAVKKVSAPGQGPASISPSDRMINGSGTVFYAPERKIAPEKIPVDCRYVPATPAMEGYIKTVTPPDSITSNLVRLQEISAQKKINEAVSSKPKTRHELFLESHPGLKPIGYVASSSPDFGTPQKYGETTAAEKKKKTFLDELFEAIDKFLRSIFGGG